MSHSIGRRLWLCLFALASTTAVPSETDGPRVLVDSLARAWNAHDTKAFADLFAEDADFVNVVGTLWKGRAEIQARHEAAHATRFKASTLAATGTVVRQLGSDVAILHFSWELTGALDPNGQAGAPRRGVMQIVAARQGKGWSIVAAQNTNIAPAQ